MGAPVTLANFVGRANGADGVMQSWTTEQHDHLDPIRALYDPDGLFPYARHGAPATDIIRVEVERDRRRGQRSGKPLQYLGHGVEAMGLEPTTSTLQRSHSSQLSYAPGS